MALSDLRVLKGVAQREEAGRSKEAKRKEAGDGNSTRAVVIL